MALLLALARNVPQAHASLDRRRAGTARSSRGVELMDKTLGILGFGRIGQLVAERAQGFGMRVLAFDPYVGAERYRELGVEKADDLRRGLRRGRLHHAPPAEDARDRGLARRRGVREDARTACAILNVARGPLIVDEDLQAALDSGKVGGAALDVFRTEPITDHPLFGYPNVIVTPHLGASTAEATDRAGFQAAEQVVAALTGGGVTTAVNVPAVARRGPRGARAVPAALPRARPARRRRSPRAASIDRVEVELPRPASPSATRAR